MIQKGEAGMRLLIGLDLGTTALKIALFDEKGAMLGVSTQEYPLNTPKVIFVEVEAETYWTAIKNGLNDLKKTYAFRADDEISLAISAQGETLLCIDKNGRVLRPAIVWMDNRAEEEAAMFKEKFQATVRVMLDEKPFQNVCTCCGHKGDNLVVALVARAY